MCVEGTNDALATKQRHQLVRSSSKERWKRQCSRRESNPFARVPGELGKGNGESQRVSERESRERERGEEAGGECQQRPMVTGSPEWSKVCRMDRHRRQGTQLRVKGGAQKLRKGASLGERKRDRERHKHRVSEKESKSKTVGRHQAKEKWRCWSGCFRLAPVAKPPPLRLFQSSRCPVWLVSFADRD